MNTEIDLVWLSDDAKIILPEWPLGNVWSASPTPSGISKLTAQRLLGSQSRAWLFWHSHLGTPDPDTIQRVMLRPGNVWHAGLKLGMSGLPQIIDFVHPTWMLNLDADREVESTSWRLSLEACLISLDVLRQMGGVSPEFSSLSGASLELGYRYLKWGVFVRHIPWMISGSMKPMQEPTFDDEMRFISYHFGRKQQYWMLFRSLMNRYRSIWNIVSTWRKVKVGKQPAPHKPYQHPSNNHKAAFRGDRVTVLIPTIDRYPYLKSILKQLRTQTVKPYEIIIVDQTPKALRDRTLLDDFSDLPIKYITQEESGQCTSRNAGLNEAHGEYILFLDDDDEIDDDLIEKHLLSITSHQTRVSSGAAYEPTSGPLPASFIYTRASDVFPTNNTMIRREVLVNSGLFDLAFNRGQTADGDLGTRIYLAGEFMVLDPSVLVLHHHAPRGGLRTHKARVITYGKSRQSLFHRRLPHVTEIYRMKRYFTARQVHEALWMSVIGTFAVRGNLPRRVLKIIVATIQLPDTLWKLSKRSSQAHAMLNEYPQIPHLDNKQGVKSWI